MSSTSISNHDEATNGTQPHGSTVEKSRYSTTSSPTNEMLDSHPFFFDLEQRDTLDTIPYKENDKYHIVTSPSSLSYESSFIDDIHDYDDKYINNQMDHDERRSPDSHGESHGGSTDDKTHHEVDDERQSAESDGGIIDGHNEVDGDDRQSPEEPDRESTGDKTVEYNEVDGDEKQSPEEPDQESTDDKTDEKIHEKTDARKISINTSKNKIIHSNQKPPLVRPPTLSPRRPSPLGMTKRTKTTTTKISMKPMSFTGDTKIEEQLQQQQQSSKPPSSPTSSNKPESLSSPPGVVQRSQTTGPGTNTSMKTNSIMNEMKINIPNPKNHAVLWADHDGGKYRRDKRHRKANRTGGSYDMNSPKSDISKRSLYINSMKLREQVKTEKAITDEYDKVCTNFGIFGIFNNNKHNTDKQKQNTEVKEVSDHSSDSEIPYDCWKLIKDECSPEYGFGGRAGVDDTADLSRLGLGSPDSRDTHDVSLLDSDAEDDDDDEESSIRQFKILGTGPDDLSAQPHVLSPPLIDSILNFVPETLSYENLWLKYSLVRDGSYLETFRQYTRASRNTILAIQTTNGDVFGSFTTSPWENQGQNCFGNGESFVWKMRLNRASINNQTLYTQAHFESEIDVYPYSGVNTTVQHCSQNMIAIGGTEIETLSPLGFSYQSYEPASSGGTPPRHEKFKKDALTYKKNEAGFAIALHDDLCQGTTSPCPTFCSPSLLSDGGEIFEVENLECWTFTPVETVNEAQKLEMRKYFVARNTSRTSSNGSNLSQKQEFSSKDLIQGEFYRRLGAKTGQRLLKN